MKLGRIVCGVLFAGIGLLVINSNVDAINGSQQPDWFESTPLYYQLNGSMEKGGCNYEVRTIQGVYPRTYTNNLTMTELNVCVYRADGFEYARYTRDYYITPVWFNGGTTLPESGLAFSFPGSGGVMTPSLNTGNKDSVEQPYLGDQTGFIQQTGLRSGMSYYKNLSQHMVSQSSGAVELDGNPDFEFLDTSREPLSVEGLGISDNGKWVSFVSKNLGVFVLNLDSLTLRRVSNRYEVLSSTWPQPDPATAISNDGAFVVVIGKNVGTEIIRASEDCGATQEVYLMNYYHTMPLENECRYVNLNSITQQHAAASGWCTAYCNFSKPRIAEDSGSFSYYDGHQWGVIYAHNKRPLSPMRYLALGDSFASGEGDMSYDDTTYYIPGTEVLGNYARNIPQEMCHISSRSYPFLIAANMNYSPSSSMRSVACSGAVRNDVLTYDTNNFSRILADNYQGQGKNHDGTVPRLAGISNMGELQDEARRDILPGRVQQIEHVQRTQPEAVTIMMGGNDLGFAEIMKGCLMNGYSLDRWSSDCDATSPRGKRVTANAIKALYPQLKHMYENINKYTLGKKVFVIGYPHFFSEDWYCVELAGKMTRSERVAINQMIDYANETIKNAALDAGVKYIDITKALSGRELCGASTGVTGFDDLALQGFMSELMRYQHAAFDNIARYGLISGSYVNSTPFFSNWYTAKRAVEAVETGVTLTPAEIFYSTLQQAVHPNSVGHRAIYTTIKQGLGEELLDSDMCNSIVICPADGAPTVERGIPNPEDYIDGLEDASNRARFVNGVSALLQNGVARNVIQAGKEVLYTWALDAAPDAQIDRSWPVTLSVHSEPRVLGVMGYAGSTRRFELAATLPESFPAGAHTLHISATSTDGVPLDIVKNIFVVGPEDDLDNDGVGDDKDMCAFGVSNGVDADHDNIADNCDLHVEASSASKSPNDMRVTAPSAGSRELIGVTGRSEGATSDVWIRNGVDTEKGIRFGAALPLAIDGVEMGERRTEPMADDVYRPFWWMIWLLLALIAVLTGRHIVKRIRARA